MCVSPQDGCRSYAANKSVRKAPDEVAMNAYCDGIPCSAEEVLAEIVGRKLLARAQEGSIQRKGFGSACHTTLLLGTRKEQRGGGILFSFF